MDFVCRDYVYSWYRKLGSSQEFPVEVRTTLARVLSILAEKMGEVSNFAVLRIGSELFPSRIP
jgi:hypothetical protein